MSPSWGVYSGYELFENTPAREGSEEYLNSEKYQYRPRDWAAAEREGRSLAPLLAQLNHIRRAHPALQRLRNLRFHHADGDEVIVYSKRVGSGPDADCVLVVVNLDPHATRETTVRLDMPAIGLEWWDTFEAYDELGGGTFTWRTENYVRLDPAVAPAHVFTVRRGA
jgi:starch synthase (maltosyl-transferring)